MSPVSAAEPNTQLTPTPVPTSSCLPQLPYTELILHKTQNTMSASSTTVSNPTGISGTTSLTQSIEKLDGSMASGKSNYQAWRFRVIRILKEKGLLTDIEENLDTSDDKALSRDNAAFTILTLNVKDSQITHIEEWTSAKDA